MTNTKTKNPTLLLLTLSATMMIQPPVRAEIGLGEIWGTAWTIGNIIVGETTLTPAYKLESYTWYFRETGLGPGTDHSITKKMKWDKHTGLHFFHTKIQSPTSPLTQSDAPFMITSVNKLNMTCKHDVGGGTIVTDTTLETHREWVWMAKVESTGLWPDDGPWKVWLKTAGYKTGCIPRTPVEVYFWVSASIGKSGGQTVSLGTPNCILNYPFYLANDFYK